MLISNEELKTTFEVPDVITYRDMLRYDAAAEMRPGEETYIRLWAGVCALAKNWKSEIVPEANIAILDQPLNPAGLQVIKWANLELWRVMWDLKQIPKN
jgi:hypothetical protein